MTEALPRILYQDDVLLAVDKPAGRLVIPGRGLGAGSPLVSQLSEALGLKLFVVHRLDRETSGVLLFAKDADTHRRLSALFEAGSVLKTYLALVRGRLGGAAVYEQPIAEFGSGRRGVKQGGKASRTEVLPLEWFGERATLVEAHPKTGRRHQIRVHLFAAGHPLLGDRLYGEVGASSAPRCMLHAARVSFKMAGRRFEASAPLPADFEGLLRTLRK